MKSSMLLRITIMLPRRAIAAPGFLSAAGRHRATTARTGQRVQARLGPERSAKKEEDMGDDWPLYILVFGSVGLVMVRLDRLSRQLDAVCASIKEELVPDEERKREILEEWKNDRREAAKEVRQFWIFWGIIGAAVLAWMIVRHT
jgi:hypothetical protein